MISQDLFTPPIAEIILFVNQIPQKRHIKTPANAKLSSAYVRRTRLGGHIAPLNWQFTFISQSIYSELRNVCLCPPAPSTFGRHPPI